MISIAVTAATSVHELAGSIRANLLDNQVMHLDCAEASAVNQAIKGMAIARGLLANDLSDLYCRPVLLSPGEDWNKTNGIRFEVRIDE